ncbi:MAG: DUF1345 domain-containing protein [Polyangiaceae bacterium]
MSPQLGSIRKHAVVRIAIALASGFAAYFMISPHVAVREALLLSWNSSGLVLLGLAWSLIVKADADTTRARASYDDPGRTIVYAIVVLTSAVSLTAATVLAGNARALSHDLQRFLVAQCVLTVALAWAVTHTAFTLRYAHLYYREDREGVGGVVLPGGEPPCFVDFAYFAFTIGMCFQVSDVTVTSRQIRRVVLLHALISFAYNSLILAFVLNLVFSLAT